MDEQKRKKLTIYILRQLIRSGLRRRRMLSLILYIKRRQQHRIEQYENLIQQNRINFQENLMHAMAYFLMRDPSDRRFWTLPCPQYLFEELLVRRDLDFKWPDLSLLVETHS